MDQMQRAPLLALLSLIDVVVLGSAALEITLFFEAVNIFATVVLCGGWILIRSISLTQYNLIYFPASFLMMLGLGLYYFALPLPLTLLEWKEVTYNLRVPYATLTHHGLFVTIVALTHYAYTHISGGRNFLRAILSRTSFYIQPSASEIWASALIGFSSSYYTYFMLGVWQIDASERGPSYYIAANFSQFIWMPLLLIFPKLRGIQTQPPRLQNIFIILYAVALALIAVASNWRTILFSGVIIFALLSMLSWLQGDFEIRKRISIKSIFATVGLLLLVTGPLVDFGYAMVAVRGTRSELSASELLAETYNAYTDKAAIRAAKDSTSTDKDSELLSTNYWNEVYLSNAIENRFVNLKISDNCLFYAEAIGTPNSEMQAEAGRQLLALMPNIVLGFFGINVSQKYAVSYSIGDYLYSLAINDSSALGSAVISSMPGVGMSIFGYWYLLVLIPLFSLIFYLFDSLSTTWNGRAYHSYLFFTTIAATMNYFNDRHVYVSDFRYILRTYWESIFFFFACMFLVRLLLKLIGFRSVTAQ